MAVDYNIYILIIKGVLKLLFILLRQIHVASFLRSAERSTKVKESA